MDWARILAYVTGTVDQELLGRNECLAAKHFQNQKRCHRPHAMGRTQPVAVREAVADPTDPRRISLRTQDRQASHYRCYAASNLDTCTGCHSIRPRYPRKLLLPPSWVAYRPSPAPVTQADRQRNKAAAISISFI